MESLSVHQKMQTQAKIIALDFSVTYFPSHFMDKTSKILALFTIWDVLLPQEKLIWSKLLIHAPSPNTIMISDSTCI